MKIDILGWYGHGNIGDEAFKLSFPKLLPDHELAFVEEIQSDDADAYILGGGDVFYPTYTRFLKPLVSKPKLAISISLTQNSDFGNVNLFEKIYVRDDKSLALGKEKDPVKFVYLPDVTFLLQPNPTAGRAWLEEAFDADGLRLRDKVVVCVISAYTAFNQDNALARDYINFHKLAVDLANAADNIDASFVFLPFGTTAPYDDRMSNSFIAGKCKYYMKNYCVHQRLDVQATLNILSCANAVVSTRLHSSIFSTISGIPFIDLTHHDKNIGFIETVGKLGWSIPLWEFSISKYKSLLDTFLKRGLPDAHLKAITDESRQLLHAAQLF